MSDDGAEGDAPSSLALHEERLRIGKRLRTTLVRVIRRTAQRFVAVDETLSHNQVVVKRMAIGRIVEAVPPVREEDGVTILPVVEEQLVLVRRLVLTEEIHVQRIQTTTQHVETVMLRRQEATATRTDLLSSDTSMPTEQPNSRGTIMSDETIVAIYDTAAHAKLAASDLRQAGVPESAISIHAGSISADHAGTTATATAPREQGFWASLFGGSPDHDTSVYERSIDNGASVLTVKTPEKHVARVLEIVESHKPIDIDERATSYGTTQAATAAAPVAMASTNAVTPSTPVATGSNGMIQLSEESLSVGKRVVNRGGTRIRRFVVEHPVEESVNLHSETAVLDRHPVTDGRPTADSFSEKTIEMMETAEEAVVSKTAHVYEEVGLRREASDRTETVRDTVRREEVEVEKIPGSTTVKDGPTVTRPSNS